MNGDRVLERVQSAGVKASTSLELIAVGFSRRPEDVAKSVEMARDVLKRFSRIEALGDASFEEIRDLTGLERHEVLQRQALLELGRRAGMANKGEANEISCAQDVADALEYLRHEKREHFVLLMLDAKNCVLKKSTIHIGTLTMSIVGPREVFREAIREGASSIVVAHNHPSGDPTPSPEDIDVTKKLAAIGDMLDIPLLDHVIIGAHRPVSLKEVGLF